MREAELETDAGGLPWWAWLALPPFAGPAAAMMYLRSHWQEIPARYPVHFALNGEPDRWVTERAVYAPMWFAEGMLVLMLLLSTAVLIGSRKSVRPTAIPGIFVGAMYLMSMIFAAVGLMPLVQVPPMALLGLTLAFGIAMVAFAYRRNADRNAPAEATPDECWILGGVYNNPKRPGDLRAEADQVRLHSEFRQRVRYVVLGGFALGLTGLAVFLRWAKGG
jgi:hypothetical protein